MQIQPATKTVTWGNLGFDEGFADKPYRSPGSPMSADAAYSYGYDEGQAAAGRAGRRNYGAE